MGLKYYDISPPITETIAVFPGDQAFHVERVMDFKNGDHLGLSWIRTTVHLGAHVDGPNHYTPGGSGIGERSLDFYMGHCQVITVPTRARHAILPDDFAQHKISSERILFRTLSFPNPDQWTDAFMAVAPETIHFLAQRQVRLVGIDTPSIDISDSKDLPAHNAIALYDMAILEGVDLSKVPDGEYELIALPLRLMGVDASPVRAILRCQG